MSRRLTAAGAAALLSIALLPAVPAFASAASTANLVVGQAVYPGSEDRTFTIRVTNNEALVTGKTINAIQVSLPIGAEITFGASNGSAPGFPTVQRRDFGDGQFLVYRGGSLAPGQSVDVTFPAKVGAPTAKDVFGQFEVLVSSNNFQTAKDAAGNLTSKVQVLEIVQDGLKPLEPTSADGKKGVTDRTGTAGQSIVYGTRVRNYAETALSVVANVGSTAGDVGTPTTVSVPAGTAADVRVPVALGTAVSNRATNFTSTAVATDATAPSKTDTFTVQAPATLGLGGLAPTRTSSGGVGRDFTVRATKAGSQVLDLTSSTLTIGNDSGTAVDSTTKQPFSATAPKTFPSGASTADLTYLFAALNAPDGEAAAKAVSKAVDDNLAGYTYDADLGKIVIDNVAPFLKDLAVGLPNDADGKKQTAIKNGDTITVKGAIDRAGDIAAGTLKVVVQPDKGMPQTVPVTLNGSGESRTFDGTLKLSNFDATASFFTVDASVADTAGNTDKLSSTKVKVDNVVPRLSGTGQILKANEVEVTFADATGVYAGCNPNAYTVNGTPGSVTAVRTSDATDCATSGTGGRILTLRNPLEVDQTPEITYNFNAAARNLLPNPVKDGAGNDALTQTVQTINGLTPLAPGLVAVDRRDSASTAADTAKPFETAYLDTENGTRYTNIGGDKALRVTVNGIRQGYTLEVLNNGVLAASQKFDAAPAPLASSYSGNLEVPLPATPAAGSPEVLNDLAVRFRALNGKVGEAVKVPVVLERNAPSFGTSSGRQSSSVTGTNTDGTSNLLVGFSEKVVAGSNAAEDWFVSETIPTETGTTTRLRNVNEVSGTDLQSRTLVARLLDPTKFLRADYFLQSEGGRRYEDRAGNEFANTLLLKTQP